jgi:hypothetical protein
MACNNLLITYVVSVYKDTIPENLYVVCSCGHEGKVSLPYNGIKKMPYIINVNCSNCKSNGRHIVDHVKFKWGGYTFLEAVEEN